jgi:hypothetical protein
MLPLIVNCNAHALLNNNKIATRISEIREGLKKENHYSVDLVK